MAASAAHPVPSFTVVLLTDRRLETIGRIAASRDGFLTSGREHRSVAYVSSTAVAGSAVEFINRPRERAEERGAAGA
jgi:hypothetical protein